MSWGGTNKKAPELIAKGVSKRFGNVEALRDVEITLFAGKVSVFVGPNGAGKTTLFHVLSGSLAPDAGEVFLDGKDITGRSPWRIARMRVGKLFQDVRIFENLSVLDNVRVALLSVQEHRLISAFRFAQNRAQDARHREEAMSWLEYVGLTEHASQLGGELSFGQQKLLAIARLLAFKSNLLLLDEPTAGLSPVMTEKMVELIRHLIAEKNRTVALIEHNMRAVKDLACYTYFMHEGGIHCHGEQHSVLEDPAVRELYMGLTGTAERNVTSEGGAEASE